MDKLERLQDDIDEATEIMRDTMDAAVGRGEHLELLVDKSDGFSRNAAAFNKDAGGLKRAMWWKNVRMMCMIASGLLALVLVGLWSRGYFGSKPALGRLLGEE